MLPAATNRDKLQRMCSNCFALRLVGNNFFNNIPYNRIIVRNLYLLKNCLQIENIKYEFTSADDHLRIYINGGEEEIEIPPPHDKNILMNYMKMNMFQQTEGSIRVVISKSFPFVYHQQPIKINFTRRCVPFWKCLASVGILDQKTIQEVNIHFSI